MGNSQPKSPDDWVAICEREIRDIKGAYHGKLSNVAKIGHALMATEAVLKAILWKHEKWTEWPPKNRPETKFVYQHNLDTLLERCGFRTRLQSSPKHNASWKVLVNAAVKQVRYSPTSPSDAEANAVAKSARHPDTGIVPWLLKNYRQMK